MSAALSSDLVMRRSVLQAASGAVVCILANAVSEQPCWAATDNDETALIKKFVGGAASDSSRVHVQMPAVFDNGYSVPLTLVVDCPMTETDHVRAIHVLAPKNPIVPVANFQFTPQNGLAKVSTRIRLAESQNVLAIAEMNDGTLLMGRSWVKVDLDGCK